MANQISASVPDQAKAGEQTAAHLTTFWSPSMIDVLAAYAAEHPDDVTPSVLQALTMLRAG